MRPPFLFLPTGEKETRISALRAALRAVALRNAAAAAGARCKEKEGRVADLGVAVFLPLLRNALGVLLVVDFCRLVTKLHTEG